MTDARPDDQEFPSVEVRAFRDGQLVACELCSSDEEVQAVLDEWDGEGVRFEYVDAWRGAVLAGEDATVDAPGDEEWREPDDGDDQATAETV